MTNFARLLTATVAIGGLATPAAAQYNQYPQQTYPQYQQTYPQQGYPVQTSPYSGQAYGYPQQGYGQSYGNNSISGIINQLLGNQYNVTDRQAVSQCAAAAVAQAQNQYGNQYRGNGYNQGYGQGYNRGYGYQQGYAAPAMRVTAITDVQRRSSGLRVKGMLSSGYGGNRGYGGNGQYGQYGQNGYQNGGYAAGDLTFRCNVDYRGAVTNVRISSNDTYRRY
jgi:hypothetical protein